MEKIVGCFLMMILVVAASHLQDHENENYHEDHYAPPKYVYEYGVNDPHTRDIKKQWESRDGDVVKGSYKLVQPDGRIRIVNYYADGKNGFNAEVKFQGMAHHPGAKRSKMAGPVASQAHVAHRTLAARPTSFRHSASSAQRFGSSPVHGHSALSMGYSVGLAGGLDPHSVGFDAQEPHAYEVEEHY